MTELQDSRNEISALDKCCWFLGFFIGEAEPPRLFTRC
jgi:hypothetical protein